MTEPHPSFAQPTISEAVCEIRYSRESDEELPSAEFYRRVADDYPEIEPFSAFDVQLELSPSGLGQRLQASRPGLRFKSTDGAMVLQLTAGVLTISVLAPYPGWDTFERRIDQAWLGALDLLSPRAVDRIGLRYINQIPRDFGGGHLDALLQATDFVPAGALRSQNGLLMRLQASPAQDQRIIVQLATQEAREGGGRYVLLDIDRINEGVVAASQQEVLAVARALHAEVWEVYSAALSPGLRENLQGSREDA